MDAYDSKILRVLQRDGRITNQQLAEEVGLSPAASWRRVKAMEESGIIRGYGAQLDPQAVNLGFCVLLNVSLTRHAKEVAQNFIEAVQDRPEVLQCWALTGDYDFTLRIVVPDINAFDHFLEDFIFTIPGVSQVKSNIALREIKNETALPV
ncbi:Lrp/AsnC family transcriptional regulator [Proteobacteria bacterium 005FR1]|nr:Lrp/AsnC family transcriptional regulator [Proteobacteria bacterium 005FR1]